MKAFTMNSSHPPPRNYVSLEQGHALSGKIMLSAVVILFTVVFFIICFHIYSRCVFRRQLLNNRSRGRHPYDYGRSGRTGRTTNFVFTTPYLSNDTNSGGLDAAILKLIPKFIYSSATHNGDLLECAVCLSEFEENEEGRTLPKCNHSFHSECIDMWFHSHSTCPLCRSLVTKPEIQEPVFEDIPIQIVIETTQSAEARTSSGVPCSSCKNEGAESGSNSAPGSSSRSSNTSLTIEIQRNGEICKSKLEEKIGGSLAGNQNLKSPGSRISSLKRILSREKIASISALSCVKIDPGIGEAKEELDQVNPVQQ